MNICMHMNIIYTHSMVTYVTAIIILLAWVTVVCKKDMGVATRLLAVYSCGLKCWHCQLAWVVFPHELGSKDAQQGRIGYFGVT